jgi:hypothetical protein
MQQKSLWLFGIIHLPTCAHSGLDTRLACQALKVEFLKIKNSMVELVAQESLGLAAVTLGLQAKLNDNCRILKAEELATHELICELKALNQTPAVPKIYILFSTLLDTITVSINIFLTLFDHEK